MYTQYYGYALKIVFRFIYRYEKATDVVNDGFVKAFRSFSKFTYTDEKLLESRLLAWIKKIMINTAIDELRRNNLMPEIGEMPDYVWEKADINDLADQKLLYKEIICHVKKLPPSYRIVFNMYVIDGYSHPEIARHLGISTGTSKSNLAKARMHLQKILNSDVKQKYAFFK